MIDSIRLTFVDDPDNIYSDQDSCLVVIPAHLLDRQSLLTILAQTLCFPDYFGENWDALYDMLCSLDWLQCHQIIIIHHDIPLRVDKQAAEAYLSILNDSIKVWEAEKSRELIIVFPTKYQKEIEALIESENESRGS